MRSKAWYVHFPGDAYALGPLRFDRPLNESEARAAARYLWNGPEHPKRRLPQGTEVWPVSKRN